MPQRDYDSCSATSARVTPAERMGKMLIRNMAYIMSVCREEVSAPSDI